MFVKITNGQVYKYPYTIGEFRKSQPNTSYPKDISTKVLEANGIYAIKQVDPPSIDKKTHTYSWTVESVNGVWTQVWTTEQHSEETATKNIRAYRDRLLKETDWTQVADAPVNKEAWATYRQTLRDIPAQDGFPFNVTWPTEP